MQEHPEFGPAIIHHVHQHRIAYGDTDRMGYCYYGNYARFFEVARVEALRAAGLVYKEMEDEGFALPVREFSIQYRRPANYDDLIDIHTYIYSLDGSRIHFYYESKSQEGALLNSASLTLVCVDMKSGRPVRPPAAVVNLIG